MSELKNSASTAKTKPMKVDFSKAHIDTDKNIYDLDGKVLYSMVIRDSDNYKNYIDIQGNLIFGSWYPDVEPFDVVCRQRIEVFAIVTRDIDSRRNVIYLRNGEFMFDDWSDAILISTNGEYVMSFNRSGNHNLPSLKLNVVSLFHWLRGGTKVACFKMQDLWGLRRWMMQEV